MFLPTAGSAIAQHEHFGGVWSGVALGGNAEEVGSGLCWVLPLSVLHHPAPKGDSGFSFLPIPLRNSRVFECLQAVEIQIAFPWCAVEIQKTENHYKRKINSGLTETSSASAELFWVFPQAAGSVRQSDKVSHLMVVRIYLTFVSIFICSCTISGHVTACCGCVCSRSIKMKR